MKKSSPAQEEKTHKYIEPSVKIGNFSFFHFRPRFLAAAVLTRMLHARPSSLRHILAIVYHSVCAFSTITVLLGTSIMKWPEEQEVRLIFRTSCQTVVFYCLLYLSRLFSTFKLFICNGF